MAENIVANVDCYNNSAEVSWSSVKGAESYFVTAVGEEGHQVSCETNENECALAELQCGQIYNVSLTAVNAHCRRQAETNVNVTTCEREWDSSKYIDSYFFYYLHLSCNHSTGNFPG